MNRISEQILQAIEILADEKVSQLEYDKTIQATIYSIVDLDTGEYKVRYNSNIFSAFSESTDKTYEVDDEVFVVVPEGNFSGRKIITSLVSARSLSYDQLTDLQNSVFEVSPSLDALYGGIYDAEAAYGVIAGIPFGEPNSYNWIYQGPETYNATDYHGLFQQYANNYEYIRIQASFLTQFYCVHDRGNYGLEIEFYAKENNIVKYRLDVTSFNGDPYNFAVYAPQSVILKVQKNYLTGLKSIRLFEENFVPDKYVENGLVTERENLTTPNIFVKDISLQYVELKDLSDSTYYLTISTPQGIAFSSNITSINLVGRLVYEGKDLMANDKCQCIWFERDLSVLVGAENYNKDVGPGWKKIQDGGNILALTADQVVNYQDYKLLAIYNEKVVLTAQVRIYNNNSQVTFTIEQQTQGDDVVLRLVGSESLTGDWYILYPDGNYQQIDTDKESIVINPYLQYSSVTFLCAAYRPTKVYLGVVEHIIVNSESSSDLTIVYDGEDTFRYDANGDVTVEDSEKERTLQVSINWKEGYATSYYVEWCLKDGTKIPNNQNQAINPPSSMIKSLWVDNYNILHYNIQQKFKIDFNNNIIVVKIHTVNEETYVFNKEILFLKDGDQGTNGTTYVAAVRPCDASGVKLSGLHPLLYQNNAWQDSLAIRCYVYKDGELINADTTNYDLGFKWGGVNIAVSGSGDKVTVTGTGETPETQHFVRVEVDIKDKTHGEKALSIYTSYPLDVAVNGFNYAVTDISDIPSYIKYTSSGVSPQFYNNSLNFLFNGTAYNDRIESLNKDVLTIKIKNDPPQYYLEPAASFIYQRVEANKESNVGVLKMREPENDSRTLIHSIIMYLDTYGNEAINGWDGTELVIDEANKQYLFAPQIGAGEKDSQNRFSGVVMGRDSTQQKTGLYGYSAGVNTFGLMEDGKAFFGAKAGGGQIVIDGTNATIYGGGTAGQEGGNADNGMTITLANLRVDGKTTDAIKIAKGKFLVKYDGSMTATSADITGKITANSGTIGGWTIEGNRLHSGTGTKYVELNSQADGEYAIWAGSSNAGSAKFSVKRDGTLYCKGATVDGTITANSGTIGGWTIASNRLYRGSVGMGSSGNAAFWAGSGLSVDSSGLPDYDSARFLVTRSGYLYCANANISGTITAKSGKIGGWVINGNRLQNADGSVSLDPSGLELGDLFSVGANGTLTASGVSVKGHIEAEEGKIGNWIITSKGSLLHGSDEYTWDTKLDSEGNIFTRSIGIMQGNGSDQIGNLGLVHGSDETGGTTLIGITSGQYNNGAIITSPKQEIAIRAATVVGTSRNTTTTNQIWIEGRGIHLRTPGIGESAGISVTSLDSQPVSFKINGKSVITELPESLTQIAPYVGVYTNGGITYLQIGKPKMEVNLEVASHIVDGFNLKTMSDTIDSLDARITKLGG